MKIVVKRIEFGTNYTIGKMYINDKYQCFTLEDTVRETEGGTVYNWKIPHVTAIPKGTYEVGYTYSPKFDQKMPELLNVPGFTGVRIHVGNTAEDTDGCILVGQSWAGTDSIRDSKSAFLLVNNQIQTAVSQKEKILLTIS